MTATSTPCATTIILAHEEVLTVVTPDEQISEEVLFPRGKRFVVIDPEPDYFGGYDWFRTIDGRTIGIPEGSWQPLARPAATIILARELKLTVVTSKEQILEGVPFRGGQRLAVVDPEPDYDDGRDWFRTPDGRTIGVPEDAWFLLG